MERTVERDCALLLSPCTGAEFRSMTLREARKRIVRVREIMRRVAERDGRHIDYVVLRCADGVVTWPEVAPRPRGVYDRYARV